MKSMKNPEKSSRRSLGSPLSFPEAAAKVLSEAEMLTPGFTIINDISDFKPTTASAAEEIKKTQAALFQKDIGKVIRIVGKSVIASMQFSRTQREAEALYEVIEVSSMDEALKLL